MSHSDLRQVLTLTEDVAGFGADCLSGGGASCRWCGTRTLDAGIHISLVVVTDVQDIIVAFEHSTQCTKTDIDGRAVTALGDYAGGVIPLCFERCSDTRCNSRGVAKE